MSHNINFLLLFTLCFLFPQLQATTNQLPYLEIYTTAEQTGTATLNMVFNAICELESKQADNTYAQSIFYANREGKSFTHEEEKIERIYRKIAEELRLLIEQLMQIYTEKKQLKATQIQEELLERQQAQNIAEEDSASQARTIKRMPFIEKYFKEVEAPPTESSITTGDLSTEQNSQTSEYDFQTYPTEPSD